MSGKPGIAPCGHPGTHVIGTYVKCDRGCDAIPVHVDPEKTEPIRARRKGQPALPLPPATTMCPHCGSPDVEEFPTAIDALAWYIGQPSTGPNAQPPDALDWHCWKCGKVFTP